MSASRVLQGYEVITESQAYAEKKFRISAILYLTSIVGGYLLEIFFFEYTYFVLPSIAVLAIILLYTTKVWVEEAGGIGPINERGAQICHKIHLFAFRGIALLFPVVLGADFFQLTEVREWLSLILGTLVAFLIGYGAILEFKESSD